MESTGVGQRLAMEYAVSVERKGLDHQKIQGQQMLRLIETAGPQKLPPGPDSTIRIAA